MRRTPAMRAREAAQVRRYYAKLPPRVCTRLRRLRALLRAAAPPTVEGISYRIPVLRVEGRALLSFAGWKEHVSVYPVTPGARQEAERLGFETSKGTIRMPHDRPLPVTLMRRFVRECLARLRREEAARRR